MATYVAPSAIVHRVLERNNYRYWSACMKSYLEAQDLWETISSSHSNGETQSREWKKKNSAALHAIQISCGPEFFSEIENISLAKHAWETLANRLNTQSQQEQEQQQPPQPQPQPQEQQQPQSQPQQQQQRPPQPQEQQQPQLQPQQQQQQPPQPQPQPQEQQQPQSQPQQQQQQPPQLQPQPQEQQQPQSQPQQEQQPQPQPQPQPQLQTQPQPGDQAPKTIEVDETTMHGGTALHYAVKNGHLRVVRGIVTKMEPKDLEIKDSDGSTALMYAALAGITEMARCMIRKNKKLCNIANEKVEHSPLSVACMLGHKDTAKYLYTNTSIDFLSEDNGKHASRVIMNCIYSETLDIALDLLRRLPDSCKVDVIKTSRVLVHLSKKPGAFPSGIRLVFWKRWIYSRVRVPEFVPSIGAFQMDFDCGFQSIHQLPRVTTTIRITDVNPVLRRLCTLLGHVLDILPGIRQIGDLKHVHVHSVDLVNCICKEIKNSGATNYKDIGMYDAFASAAKLGISELVLALCEIHNDLFDYDEDGNGRNLLMLSIVHRQENLFDAISSYINRKGRGYTSVPIQDKFGNTMLHLAGLLSPSSQLARISGAALQMQRELQWYKQVESIMNPIYKQIKNEYGETPKQVFTNSHKELMAEGEKWMKDTATSCTVVGALIITIMFNAAFIGARHYINGFPLLSPSASFRIFIMADAISLFASSTSVLTFLGIRTMRYAEEDFSVSLPAQLIIGLSSLILSLATMMIAFCASLFMILQGARSYVIPIIYMAPVPVSIFMFSQFSLLKEVFISTFGWNLLYQMSSSFKWKLFFRWNRICLKLF